VTFTLNGVPSACTNTIGRWVLPPKYVNATWQAVGIIGNPTLPGHNLQPIGSVNYTINPDLLTNLPSTSCWYVNGPGGKVRLGTDLYFSNAQHVFMLPQGAFTIYRPGFGGFLNVLNGSWWSVPTLWAQMSFNITLSSTNDGEFGITQLLRGTGIAYDTGGQYILDGDSEIYGNGGANGPSTYTASNPMTHTVNLLDNPNASTVGTVTMHINFKDYLRFKPTGGIYVTIATNGWRVNTSANIWSGQAPGAIAPPAANPVDSDEFPVWLSNKAGH
jgi:hypothetical protein